MYDSTEPGAIPADAKIVAGYTDGLYRWRDADWRRFPDAKKVTIDVFPWTNLGQVLDVEIGDARPEDCPRWIRERQNAGVALPVIYTSISVVPEVIRWCQRMEYRVWSAHYTGVAHICSRACMPALGAGFALPEGLIVATQWTDPPGSGGHYDLSLCLTSWVDSLSSR